MLLRKESYLLKNPKIITHKYCISLLLFINIIEHYLFISGAAPEFYLCELTALWPITGSTMGAL